MAKILQKENITPGSFLDCGSGTGLLGGAIRKNWPLAHITGIDFAQDMLDRSMQDNCADETILYNLMTKDWPVDENGYDLVGAAAVLNYAADPHEFITSMADATKPSGHMILSYLSDQHDQEGITDDGSRVYLWSRGEVENCFAENKIELIVSRDVRSYSGHGLQRVDSITVGKCSQYKR